MSSSHLTFRQIRAIGKIGDVLIPGDEILPAFSETDCVKQVDRILNFMPIQDVRDLKTLISIFSFFPRGAIFLTIRLLELSPKIPGGGVLRLIRLGLRGLVMTLYYSDPKVLGLLDYQVGVYTRDLSQDSG